MQRPLLAVASDSSGAAAPPDTAPSSPSKSTKPAMRDLIKGEADKRVRPLQAVVFFVVFFLVSCGFAASQEIIVTTPGFKPLHRSFLTLSHSVAYCLFASMELARAGWTPGQRTTPLRHYLAVAVFCFLSVFLANNSDARRVRGRPPLVRNPIAGLTYIDYSTRVMFKCAKPIPTMLLSMVRPFSARASRRAAAAGDARLRPQLLVARVRGGRGPGRGPRHGHHRRRRGAGDALRRRGVRRAPRPARAVGRRRRRARARRDPLRRLRVDLRAGRSSCLRATVTATPP